MDTIAIGSSANIKEPKKSVKGAIHSATSTVVTGIVGSVAGSIVVDALEAINITMTECADETPAQAHQHTTPGVVEEAVSADDTPVEVNPDDVMLVEETPDIVEVEIDPQDVSDVEYQPFANNDSLEVDLVADDSAAEIIPAESPEELVAQDQMPCIDEMLSVPVCIVDDLTADLSTFDNVSDIQSDLMA